MILFPPAKINLGLHILGKRPDGYHALDSILLPIPWYDVLEILPAKTPFHSALPVYLWKEIPHKILWSKRMN
jgi:4-diphosphocytidyl-2C-methyl-D-erythritol kinase